MGREIAQFLAIFYADDSYIAARCPVRLQLVMTILVGLFEHVGLLTNTIKTEGITCVLGRTGNRLLEDVYNNSRTCILAGDD